MYYISSRHLKQGHGDEGSSDDNEPPAATAYANEGANADMSDDEVSRQGSQHVCNRMVCGPPGPSASCARWLLLGPSAKACWTANWKGVVLWPVFASGACFRFVR